MKGPKLTHYAAFKIDPPYATLSVSFTNESGKAFNSCRQKEVEIIYFREGRQGRERIWGVGERERQMWSISFNQTAQGIMH